MIRDSWWWTDNEIGHVFGHQNLNSYEQIEIIDKKNIYHSFIVCCGRNKLSKNWCAYMNMNSHRKWIYLANLITSNWKIWQNYGTQMHNWRMNHCLAKQQNYNLNWYLWNKQIWFGSRTIKCVSHTVTSEFLWWNKIFWFIFT